MATHVHTLAALPHIHCINRIKRRMQVQAVRLTRMNWGICCGVRPPGGEFDAHRQVGVSHVAGLHWYVSVSTRPPACITCQGQRRQSAEAGTEGHCRPGWRRGWRLVPRRRRP